MLVDIAYASLYRSIVTHLIFRNLDDVANTVARCFHHLVPNDNFHCQTPLKKNAKSDLFGTENASWE